MGTYEDTELWKKTLGPQACDDSVSHAARERLRLAYVKLRERTQHLAGEIHRYLPDFTIHDVTHSDALWYTADLVLGAETLTPTEAFVLGCAFLIHDLGMGLAAYENGIDELRRRSGWKGFVAKLARDEGLVAEFTKERDFTVNFEEKKDTQQKLSQEMRERAKRRIEEKAIEQLLRKSHAKEAAQLLSRSWKDHHSETQISYYLIEDSELRQTYGYLIGQIAYSHWWSISEIESVFHRPKSIGAVPPPWQYPRDWKVEPLLVSCLLRVADICHIDASRAPLFLRSIRNPAEPSGTHWVFQGHIQQPYLSNDRLTYTSGQPFPPEHQQAWWLCFDTLKQIDKHLRETDSLLAHLERRRLAARGVTGIEDPKFLANYIQVSDWLPLDTKLDVTDIPHLVKNLGGEALYGDEPQVPLRELIQNASDAVRARRLVDGKDEDWGHIHVRLGKGKNEESGEEQYWIEVDDTGIGMSISVLTGPFIDFGTSYWRSPLMLDEFPDALADFHPTGKYGIGFFSVFMWGEHVTVTTRRYDDGKKDTHVLEFKKGLAPRPILRMAKDGKEQRNEGGTCIRVWLKQSPYEKGGLLGPGILPRLRLGEGGKILYDLCAYICPCLYVDLLIQDQCIPRLPRLDDDQEQTKKFVEGIVSRLSMREAIAEKILDMKIPGGKDNTTFVDIMRVVKHPSQEDAGFACILPNPSAYTYTFLLNAVYNDIYIDKNAVLRSMNDENAHIFISDNIKNLPTFTLANKNVRSFTLAFGLLLINRRGRSLISERLVPRLEIDDFRKKTINAEEFFNIVVLMIKTIDSLILKISNKDQLNAEIDRISEVEKALIEEVEKALTEEVEKALIREFSMQDVSVIFTYGRTALSKVIMEKNAYKVSSDIRKDLSMHITTKRENKNSLDIIDVVITKIMKVMKNTRTIVILNKSKFAKEITEVLLHMDEHVPDNVEILTQNILLSVKNNVGISLAGSTFNNDIHKKDLFNAIALRIADWCVSMALDKGEKRPIFIDIVLEMFNMRSFMSLFKNEVVQEFISEIKEYKVNKSIQKDFVFELLFNIIGHDKIKVGADNLLNSTIITIGKSELKYLCEILKGFNSKNDQKDPLFDHYYNFQKEDLSSDSGIVTTAGLRVAKAPIRFLGNLEGEVNKASRDGAFVDENVISNWSTQQANAISSKSIDNAFLCAMAQMVRICGGDVGNLPIAYTTIGGWSTQTQISHDYAMTDHVTLISFWPDPELLRSTSWKLWDHVLVVNTDYPRNMIFRSKMPASHYSLHYVVVEALAKGWNVPVKDLIEQRPSLFADEMVAVEIGTKTYWDATDRREKSEKWYAEGYIIHKPTKSSS